MGFPKSGAFAGRGEEEQFYEPNFVLTQADCLNLLPLSLGSLALDSHSVARIQHI